MDDYKLFLICTSPRSGSSLLWSLLFNTGYIGRVDESEYFQEGDFNSYLEPFGVSYKDFFDKTSERLTPRVVGDIWEKMLSDYHKNGVWGVKIFPWDLKIFQRIMGVKGINWNAIKVVWLRRREIMKQAISMAKAEMKGIWFDNPETIDLHDKDLCISMSRIDKQLLLYLKYDCAWEYFFNLFSIKPYILYYEDFEYESQWESVVKGFLDYLEIGYRLPLIIKSNVHKQYSTWNQEVYDEICEYMLLRNAVRDIDWKSKEIKDCKLELSKEDFNV